MDYNITENATKNSLMQKHFLKEKMLRKVNLHPYSDHPKEIKTHRETLKKSFCFQDIVISVKKNRITVNKKEEYPSNIVSTVAQETLVRSATIKNDLPLSYCS